MADLWYLKVLKFVHMLLQAGVKITPDAFRFNFCDDSLTDPEELEARMCGALMLLFAGGDPQNYGVVNSAKPTVKIWLSGFLIAQIWKIQQLPSYLKKSFCAML